MNCIIWKCLFMQVRMFVLSRLQLKIYDDSIQFFSNLVWVYTKYLNGYGIWSVSDSLTDLPQEIYTLCEKSTDVTKVLQTKMEYIRIQQKKRLNKANLYKSLFFYFFSNTVSFSVVEDEWLFVWKVEEIVGKNIILHYNKVVHAV